MDIGDFSNPWIALATTVVFFFASGVVPIVNAELNVLLLGTLAPRPLVPLLLVVATLSHMVGKSLTYFIGRGAERWPIPAMQRRVAAARAKLDGRTTLGAAVIFASAAIGFPPFYLITVASGVMRYSFPRFFALGFAGRLLRFAALLLVPELARALGLLT